MMTSRTLYVFISAFTFLAAAPSWSDSGVFDVGAFGFDPASLTGLPLVVMGASEPFLNAGAPGSFPSLDVELNNSTLVCILPAGSSTCAATTSGITGPFSVLITIDVNVLNVGVLVGGPFSLMITGLGGTYSPSEVTVNLNPPAIPGLDTAAIPGFGFDSGNGVNGFNRLTKIRDDTLAPGTIHRYVGTTVVSGDSVTLRFDVSASPAGRAAPQILMNATTVFVPTAEQRPFQRRSNVTNSLVTPSVGGLGDFDGDGDIDFAVRGLNNQLVAWYENDGTLASNSWAEHLIATISGSTVAFAFPADFDGDGDLDELVVEQSPSRVSWYENIAGTGLVWAERLVTTTPVFPVIYFPGDIDNDGDIDILGADAGSGSFEWWENTAGDGSAWARQLVASGFPSAIQFVPGDMDGDGDLDGVGVDNAQNSLTFFENTNGIGTSWNSVLITTAATGVNSSVNVDIDRDGDLDVLVALLSGNSVIWYENLNGDGSSWATRTVDGALAGANVAVAQDVDRDGDMDILVAASTAGELAWYENSDGLAMSWTKHVVDATAASAHVLAGADFDVDGDLDGIATVWSDNSLRVFENATIHRSAMPTPIVIDASRSEANAVEPADVDGDGDSDLFSLSLTNGTIMFHENANGDASVWNSTQVAPSAAARRSFSSADVDGDGDLDVFSSRSGGIDWYENTSPSGDGSTWTPRGISLSESGSVVAGDIDLDGHVDLLATDDGGSNGLVWFRNSSGDGSTWTAMPFATGAVLSAEEVRLVDVDGDGDLDAVSVSSGDDKIAWYANDGSGIFAAQSVVSTLMTSPVAVSAVDLDRDGDVDLIAASSLNDEIRWYENALGDGSIWTDRSIVDGPSTTGLAAVQTLDLDLDGDFDILAVDASGGRISWFENSAGDATVWTEKVIDTFGGAPGGHPALGAADFDRDGDLDPVAADFGLGRIVWYENRGGQFALPTTATAPGIVGPYGQQDVLQFSLVHRGRSGDHTVALETLGLRFEDATNTPLTSGQLDDLLASLRVYLDDGSGVFDGGDFLVSSETSFSLDPTGTEMIPFSGGANVQVAPGQTKTYFVVFDVEPNAGPTAPSQVQITHLTEASGVAADLTFTTQLDLEFSPNTSSGVFSVLAPNDDADGDGLTNAVETGSGNFVSTVDTGSDPLVADSDLDGTDDGAEIRLGSDPNNVEQATPPFVTAPVVSTMDSMATQAELADLDGDGDLDALVTDGAVANVSWIENVDGSGPSGSPVSLGLGSWSAVAGDIDGDGDLDVVAGGDDLRWWKNSSANGDASSWTLGATIRSGSFLDHFRVRVGDIDGDGDLDVVSINLLSNLVIWHENTSGDGSTWTNRNLAPSTIGPSALDLADIDRDGDLDVVVGLSSPPGDGYFWFQNANGDGSVWGLITVTSTGGNSDAADVTTGDIDGDGDIDIMGVQNSSGTLGWAENLDGVGMSWQVNVLTGSTVGGTSIEIVDLDLDGDLDFAFAVGPSGFVWYENTAGDGSAVTLHTLSNPGAVIGNGPRWIVSGDVDGDGDADLMGLGRSGAGLELFRNARMHRGVALGDEVIVFSGLTGSTAARAADFNGDGVRDFLSYQDSSGLVEVFNSGGPNSYSRVEVSNNPSGATDFAVPGDVDGDGAIDILHNRSATGEVLWWQNSNADGVTWSEFVITNASANAFPWPADIDGDGELDVLVADINSAGTSWLRNLGGGGSWDVPVDITGGRAFNIISFPADMDGDGDQDVLVSFGFPQSTLVDGQLYWYENTLGDGTSFTEHAIEISTSSLDFALGFPADIDGDGDLDVSLGRLGEGVLSWYENTTGDGIIWVEHVVINAAFSFLGRPSDVDLDGDIDLVTNEPNSVVVYENVVGDGSVWTRKVVASGVTGLTAVTVVDGDVDLDGDDDFTFGNSGFSSSVTYRPNVGGQFGVTAMATAPSQIVGGLRDDVFQIDFEHNGRVADNDATLTSLVLRFEDGGGAPASSAYANSVVSALEIYRDDGSGVFEESIDSVVTSVSTLVLNGSSEQVVSFTSGDPITTLSPGQTKTYFVVLQMQPSPAGSIEIVHVASGAVAEDALFGLPLVSQRPVDVQSGVIASAGDTDGDGISDADEVTNGTNLGNPDSDGDGLCDGSIAVAGVCIAGEITAGTNPNSADSDGDGLGDAYEVEVGKNPNLSSDGILFREVARSGEVAPDVGNATFGDNLFSGPVGRGRFGNVVIHSALNGPGIVVEDNDDAVWAQTARVLNRVVQRADPAPGTGDVFDTISSFGGGGGAGTTFSAQTFAGDQGFWTDRSGTIEAIAVSGDAAFGAGPATFQGFSDEVISLSGFLGFKGFLTGPGVDATNSFGIWTEFGGPGLRLTMRGGDPAPAGLPGLTWGNTADCLAISPTSTHVMFRGRLSGAGVITGPNDDGFFLDDGSSVRLIAREGDPAPGTGGSVFAATNGLSCGQVDSSGEYTFSGPYAATAGGAVQGTAVWSNRTGSETKVAGTGDFAPGAGSNYTDVSHARIAENSTVTFRGVLPVNGSGVWLTTLGGPIVNVARGEAPAPGLGGGIILNTFFTNPVLSNAVGHLAFSHDVVGSGVTAVNDTGLWIDRGAGLSLVLRAGDNLELASGTVLVPNRLDLIDIDDSARLTFEALYAANTQRGVFTASFCDQDATDTDGDGTTDICDVCPLVADPTQTDSDGDGVGDACNDVFDADSDEIYDGLDNCSLSSNLDQLDADADGVGDVCDNCLVDSNPDQSDVDFDLTGDVCDADADGDGLLNTVETNSRVFVDASDTGSDPLNADTDGDGLDDGVEVALGSDPNSGDSDGDLVGDGIDNCPFVSNAGQLNSDAFGAGDACQCGDIDADGDVDSTDVAIARDELVDPTGLDLSRCNVIGPSDGGVSDCNLGDIFLLRRIVNGTPGAVPGNVCQAYQP